MPNSSAIEAASAPNAGICVDQSAGSSKYELRRLSERCARPSWSLANFEISSSLAAVSSSTVRVRTVDSNAPNDGLVAGSAPYLAGSCAKRLRSASDWSSGELKMVDSTADFGIDIHSILTRSGRR